jgi:RND family efflux transporter MFP subunit
MTSTAPRKPLDDQPDLKVTPHPTVVEADRAVAREGDATGLEPRPRRSLAARLTRGFMQLLLPVLVVGAAIAAHQYLKATRPEVAKRPAKPAIFAVQTVSVALTSVRPSLELYGTTVAGREVEIRALVAGQVIRTSEALRDGGQIEKGETILSIDPFEYRQSVDEVDAQIAELKAKVKELDASLAVEQATLKFAREQAQIAKADLARAEPLSQRGALSERGVDERRQVLSQRRQAVSTLENNVAVWQARIAQQKAAINRLEANRRRAAQKLAETELKAPFDAYVTDVGAQVGRMVSVNDRVATLIDRNWIEVAFTVTDRQFGRLARGPDGLVGRKVKVSWNVGKRPFTYNAMIDRVGASVSATAGGVQVFARIEDPATGVGLRPGAFVEVSVPDTNFESVARLPGTAIFDTDTVFVVADGKLQSRRVDVLASAGSDVLVRGDIRAGEKIMTTRLSLPGDGVRVREIAADGS